MGVIFEVLASLFGVTRGIPLVVLWIHLRVNLGVTFRSPWGYHGISKGVLFGIILGHFGIILELFGCTLGTLCGYPVDTLK